jgi:molybdopterin-binding protein
MPFVCRQSKTVVGLFGQEMALNFPWAGISPGLFPSELCLVRSGASISGGVCYFLHHGEGEPVMRLSARNQIKGTVSEVKKGATTAHVKVDIGGGQVITSSITNEAVDDLAIKAGSKVAVVIKASDVMIATD